MKNLLFEWYVINRDINRKKIIHYNIFNNRQVLEETNKLCVKYKRDKMSFEDFTKELDNIIKWQEWARCEYEVLVGDLFANSCTELEKIDCYWQATPNIKIIAKYVLEEYYLRLKINLCTGEEKD